MKRWWSGSTKKSPQLGGPDCVVEEYHCCDQHEKKPFAAPVKGEEWVFIGDKVDSSVIRVPTTASHDEVAELRERVENLEALVVVLSERAGIGETE